MKIKTKEQYNARFKRRAPKQPKRTYDLSRDDFDKYVGDGLLLARLVDGISAKWSKPDHAARYVSLNEYYGSLFKPQKSPDFVKMPLIGNWDGCPHTLALWREDEPDRSGHRVFVPAAMPCVVQHGFEAKVMYGREQLVPAMGKKGEHQDKLGRVW